MKHTIRAVLILIAAGGMATAQEVNGYVGLGIAHDSATNQNFDTFGDGTPYPAKPINGLFWNYGFSVLGKRFGAGFDMARRIPQATYTGLGYRPLFYSFDGIFQPARTTTKHSNLEFRLGIGGANLSFNPDDQQSCVNGPGCTNPHHFQVHMAEAWRFYVKDHLFIRPAFDLHYVNNFSEFGSNWVPRFSFGIGYSLGR